MEKFSLRRFREDLERSRIPKDEIPKIIEGMELLERKGIASNDLELILRNIIDNKAYKESFIKDPLATAGGYAPPYIPVTPKK